MANDFVIRRGLASFDLYPYNPSAVAGWAFVVVFGLGGVVHLIYMFPLRAWFFIPFILGCVGEAFGYYGRAWSHNNIRNGSPYLIQMMLILASAPLLSASIYMTLGRITRALDAKEYAIISPRWLSKIYVLIDIGSFVCQLMGSAMQSSGDPSGIKTGMHLVMGGLGFQLVAFVGFIISSIVLHRRLNDKPTAVSRNTSIPWRRHIWTLYFVSVIILIRSAYRLIEFAGGNDSPLVKHEAFIYIFDASFMSMVVFSLAIIHPGQLLKTVRKLNGNCPGGEEDSYALVGNK